MRIAIFTLTRDRLDYTKRTFESLRSARPGIAYDHWVFDQGSEDGTREWLCTQVNEGRIHKAVSWPKNLGQHVGSNRAHDVLADYDIIVRVDNDAEFKTRHWLRKLVAAQRLLGHSAIVAPRIVGLNNPPEVFGRKTIGAVRFSFVEILGGICRLMPAAALKGFKFDERLPLAIGEAAALSAHARKHTIPMAYVENVIVKHMDTTNGQEAALPGYFGRSFYERHVPYGW